MESNTNQLNDSLKRHFNLPINKLLNLKPKENWRWINNGINLTNADRENFPLLNEEKNEEFKHFLEPMNNYEDVIFANRDYQKANEIRKLYCGHIMRHLQKCRTTMRKNNDRISDHGDKISNIRDQGFHRCRIMIVLPTRNSALETVKCLRSFMAKKHKVTKKYNKFLYNYSQEAQTEQDEDDDDEDEDSEVDEDDDEDDGETSKAKELMATINQNRKLLEGKHAVKKRGIDFDEWTNGNTNERFLFGVAIDKKLFNVCSRLPLSDIVIGSPLSIKELMDDKKSYLTQLAATSSVEMFVMDQAEYMMMQNFDNLYPCLEKLNQTPRGGGECTKVMNSTLRVHDWALANHGVKYRQNIIISAILHPLLKKIMSACHNFQGTTIFPPQPHYNKNDSKFFVNQLLKQIEEQQTKKSTKVKPNKDLCLFTRMTFSMPVPEECQEVDTMSTDIISNVTQSDSRLSLFRRKVVPLLAFTLNTGGVLLYFTLTIDLYNVQQLLVSENLKVACISEDQDVNQIQSIITLFAKGAIKYLLVTERYYALTRQRLSAAKHLIYYTTPSFPKFARDFHEFLMFNSKATIENPHNVINICEEESFEMINSQLAFNVLYGQ